MQVGAKKPLKLTNLVLRNFRNYTACDIGFPRQVTLILGGNAQGKTSLLEAIYFLCTAESHRASPNAELIRYHAEGFYLKGLLNPNGDENENADEVSLCLEATKWAAGQFKLKKNGVLQTKRSAWLGQFNVVFFAPESLTLVKGAPMERRRFLDLLISQVDKNYLSDLQTYRAVLKQRNELLKQFRTHSRSHHGGRETAQLGVWDELLVESGTAIIVKRLEVLQQLKRYALQKQKALTGGRETLILTYQPAWQSATKPVDIDIDESARTTVSPYTVNSETREKRGTAMKNKTQVCTTFRETLHQARETDLRRGTTTVGPHRDDVLMELETERQGFLIRERARAYGSQGQQRTIALALKLAEVELIRQTTGTPPLVLLDDVVSELDEKRTVFLLDVLQQVNAQTFITATQQATLLNYLEQPAVFTVENGQVFCCSQGVR